MKKIYVILLAIPLLGITLMYLSVEWFIGGMAVLLAFVAYQIYADRFRSLQSRNRVLEDSNDQLNGQLEQAVLKEQRAKKDAQQSREMKQRLLSVLSHEIRTPMNGVLGNASLLEATPLSAEQRSYVATIRQCGEDLVSSINNLLVHDILDISKLQTEEHHLEFRDFNLRDSIEEVIDLFGADALRKGIDLLYRIGEDVPEQLIGDSKRLRQVLTNLTENAVRHTRDGQVLVNVLLQPPAMGNPDPQLIFEVIDSGEGMGPEQINDLFKGIVAKPAPATRPQERGLGLVICKKLVELMGGQLSVESRPGQGSRFRFVIPGTPSLHALRQHAREQDMAVIADKKILLVDDNPESLALFGDMLRSWKVRVTPALSGEDAMRALAQGPGLDAVLIDMNLPEGGDEVLTQVRTQYSGMPVGLLLKPLRQHILRETVLDLLVPPSPVEDKPTALFAAQHPLRILVAEDNIVNQKIASKILSSLGYTAAVAGNGKEAVEMAGSERFDLILMDVQMPEMDGFEATRLLRTCLPVQPVIIALTANAMQGDRDECMQAGMDDYMSKPIDMDELMRQLQRWYRARKEQGLS